MFQKLFWQNAGPWEPQPGGGKRRTGLRKVGSTRTRDRSRRWSGVPVREGAGPGRRRRHPPDHIPAEDVDQDVEVAVRPLLRSEQPVVVLRPSLVGGRRHELGRDVDGMRELVAELPNRVVPGQDPLRRAL